MPRCAVLGSPVAHSLSPVLHTAAYAALGLRGWTYDRRECRSGELAPLLAQDPRRRLARRLARYRALGA